MQGLLEQSRWDFGDLNAVYINCTLKRSPETSNTQALADRSIAIMRHAGVGVEIIRAVDHEIATGVYPDMTEHGWPRDEWPAIFDQHLGFTVPPQADSGWLGEAGPGPSYCDPGSGGPENDFTNRNTTFLT